MNGVEREESWPPGYRRWLESGRLGAGHDFETSNLWSDCPTDFYHFQATRPRTVGLRRFVVFELKVGQAEPEHIGRLNFYVNAVDDQLRRPEHGDGATIGILLAATRDDIVVEYALRGIGSPLAVSTYTTYGALPDDIRPSLPTADDLADAPP